MSKETKYEVHFDETMQNLFLDMNRIQKDFGLKRINSIILLKALLEEKNSILYDFLCATTISKNPYKNIIQDGKGFSDNSARWPRSNYISSYGRSLQRFSKNY